MAVEITGLPAAVLQTNDKSTAKGTAQESTGQGNAAPNNNVDVVTLTSQATHMKAMEANTSKESTVDSNRIENLKAAIDSGSYVIDPARVAEKFIAFEFSLSA